MKIAIEPYSAKWKTMFEQEKHTLTKLLGNVFIEHMGSTAVEGLGAKPIIDILIGLPDFGKVDSKVHILTKVHYNYIQEYESTFPDRRFFSKSESGSISHHIHMVEYNSGFWLRHLKFRNHLRMNKKDREDYYALKLKLSKQEWKDGNEYAEAKTNFISEIEDKI